MVTLWEQISCLDRVVLGEPGSSRCKADGFRRLFLRSAQKVQLWLDILEGLCPIEVGQFLLVQADKMPY